MKLYWAREVREGDRMAIEEMGMPSLTLMENAARAIVRALIELVPELLHGRVAVCCGKGNNGGDGMAVARLLKGAGYAPEVLLLAEPTQLSPDARAQYERILGCGLVCRILSREQDMASFRETLSGADLVIDALLGTGLGGPVRGMWGEAIAAINSSSAFVDAVDIPSGLSGDALAPDGPAVRADLALTLALPKPILYTAEGAAFCGEVQVLDIGIPAGVTSCLPFAGEALDDTWARPFFKGRSPVTHKGDLGRILLVAGSVGKSGAAVLAARGALRTGAGLVTVACPTSAQPAVAASLPEAMTLALPETREGTLSMDALMPLLRACEGADALGLGPGLGQVHETAALCREIFKIAPLPAVADADGLNAFASQAASLSAHAGPRVLTPHPGEMARLVESTAGGVIVGRFDLLPSKAAEWDAVVLLKGYRTLIAAPGAPWRMNLSGGPHMAGPGFGDVLTGMVAALLGRGLAPADAAALAAWWHGAAADEAQRRLGGYGLLASECADALPAVEGQLRLP